MYSVRIMSESMTNIKIENIVASTSLGRRLDLQSILPKLEGAEYDPSRFPGLIYRIKEPKTATLLFTSGKTVCTGAKSVDDLSLAIRKVESDIKAAGVDFDVESQIEIQNIVASSDLKQEVNLNDIAIGLGLENVEYEPEQFPGLVYRNSDPKVVILIFSSGKLVCTGAKNPQQIETAVDQLIRRFKNIGILS